MKGLISILRATIVGGVLFLAPFVVLIIILGKAIIITGSILTPVAEKLPIESLIGLETPKILAAVVLLLVCFLAGLFAKTALATKMVSWLEKAILSNLPGYSFIKNLGEEVAGTTPTQGYEVVLVRFDEAWQIGFLVERIPGGHVVVFVPDAPSPWTGGVFIFNEDRITPLKATSTSAVNCLRKLGAGTGDLVKGVAL
jgi:uncharacterized membrane protein